MIKIIIKFIYTIIFNLFGDVQYITITNQEINKQLTTLQQQKPTENSLVLIFNSLLEHNQENALELWKSIKKTYPMSYIVYANCYKKHSTYNANNRSHGKKPPATSSKFMTKEEYIKKKEESYIKQIEERIIGCLKLVGCSSIDKKVFLPIMKNNKYNPLLVNDILLYINNAIRLEVWLLLFIIYHPKYKSDIKRLIIVSDEHYGLSREFFIFLKDIPLIFIEVKTKSKK